MATVEPPVSGLIAWWPGEGSANDVVGSNHGTLQNGATFAIGKLGQAFYFDGVDDSVQIPVDTSFQSPTLSIVAWVKPLSEIDDFVNGGTLGQEMIFGQSGGTHQLVVQPGTGGMKVVAYWLGGGSEIGAESVGVIPMNQFSHVAGTWDGTTGKVYINGELEGQAPAGTSLRDSLCPFEIGGLGCWNGQFFNAVIDELKLYDRALTANEVQAIFNDS